MILANIRKKFWFFSFDFPRISMLHFQSISSVSHCHPRSSVPFSRPCLTSYVPCPTSLPCLPSNVPYLTRLYSLSPVLCPLSHVRLCALPPVRCPQPYVSISCLPSPVLLLTFLFLVSCMSPVPCLTWSVPCLPASFLRPLTPINCPFFCGSIPLRVFLVRNRIRTCIHLWSTLQMAGYELICLTSG